MADKKIKKSSSSNLIRVKTGIPGFDSLIEGGFPKNSSILVCGGPGTGKTIFCTEFLVAGARDFNEKGLYVTFEQRADAIREQAKQFGWDLNSLEKKGNLTIMAIPASEIKREVIEQLKAKVKKEGIKRLVIDSLSTLVVNAPIYVQPNELSAKDVIGSNVIFSPPIIGDYIVKRFIYDFIEELRGLDCTTLLITESGQGSEFLTRDTLSEFVCDGVIVLTLQETLNMRRVQVRKLRSTIHPLRAKELELTSKGIVVKNEE